MIERIAIAPDLDLMGRTERELRALDDQGAALRTDAMDRRGRTAGLQAILHVGVAWSGLALLWYGSQGATAPSTVAASLSVLALVAIPLQDLGAAWDRFCAWRVARDKALRLLSEPTVSRSATRAKRPVAVRVSGATDFTAAAGAVTRTNAPEAARLARVIAGFDNDPGLTVRFDDDTPAPHIAFIGDTHIGVQGSLRRSVTLCAARRPKDAKITKVLTAFGLGDLHDVPRGLDRRIAENGKGLSAAQTLRLDLARAVLGRADVIVISSLRWTADPRQDELLATLQTLTRATIILAEDPNRPISHANVKVS